MGVTGGDQGDDKDVFTEMLVMKSPGPGGRGRTIRETDAVRWTEQIARGESGLLSATYLLGDLEKTHTAQLCPSRLFVSRTPEERRQRSCLAPGSGCRGSLCGSATHRHADM